MFYDLTREQKRALRAAAELARQRDREMTREDAEAYYLDVPNADLPIIVGGAVARGVIGIDEVGDPARELVADFAERVRAVTDREVRGATPEDRDEPFHADAAVSLSAIVDEIDLLPENSMLCVNRRSGEIRFVDMERFDDEEPGEADEADDDDPEWLRDERALQREVVVSEEWIRLLGRHDIDEYGMMKRFARDARPAASRDLNAALSGRGAFRRFGSVIRERALEEEWERFRANRLNELVRWRLTDAGVPFRK